MHLPSCAGHQSISNINQMKIVHHHAPAISSSPASTISKLSIIMHLPPGTGQSVHLQHQPIANNDCLPDHFHGGIRVRYMLGRTGMKHVALQYL
jgi:hypothetical protein